MCKETLPHPVWTAGQEHREGLVSAALNSLETETKREKRRHIPLEVLMGGYGVFIPGCVCVCVCVCGCRGIAEGKAIK